MVSTRSSARRQVGSEPDAQQQQDVIVETNVATRATRTTTRSAKRTAGTGAELNDQGQPEVTSPAKEQDYLPLPGLAAHRSPPPSPLPPSTMKQQLTPLRAAGSPPQERLVKSVGPKSQPGTAFKVGPVPPTPAAAAAAARTALPKDEDEPSSDKSGAAFYATDDDVTIFSPPNLPHKDAKCMPLSRILGIGAAFVIVALIAVAGSCFHAPSSSWISARLPVHTQVCSHLHPLRTHVADAVAGVPDRLREAAALPQQWIAAVRQQLRPRWAELKAQAVVLMHRANAFKEHILAHASQLVNQAIHKVRPAPPAPQGFTAAMPMTMFQSLADDTHDAQSHAAELWHHAPKQLADKNKATAVVLACTHAAECKAAAATAAASMPAPCSLTVSGAAYGTDGDAAGALQAELTAWLTACANGVVVVTSPEQLSLSAATVFNNMLSEGGHLWVDGEPVLTKQALYVFVLDTGRVDASEVESHAKESLARALLAKAGSEEEAVSVVRSLRRRLDAVLPAKRVPRPPPLEAETDADEGAAPEPAASMPEPDTGKALGEEEHVPANDGFMS